MILREAAQGLLLLAYGGQLSHDEMGFTEAQVAYWLTMARDSKLREALDAKYDSFQPDPAYYTRYDKETLIWDSTREMYYWKLPKGNPPQVVNCLGIKIQPVTGGGSMFRYTPYDFIAMNPRLAFLEGNYSWEANGDGKVWFTNMSPQVYDVYIAAWVIETGARDLDAESGIPGDILQECYDIVLERMGLGRLDTKTDGIDQRAAGDNRR
jgi:hypothetical protein